jgi:nicotinamidase-related amidase
MAKLKTKRTGVGKRPALLIVDASNAFTDPDCVMGAEFSTEVAAIAQLLDRFRGRGFPVYFTTVAYSKPEQGHIFREKVDMLNLLVDGNNLVQIDPRIAPLANETIVTKFAPSAFFETGLKEQMLERGVDTVFVTGFTTSGCVRASGVDSLSCNFRTVVVRDCVGDRDPPAHDASLYDLEAKYADVVSLAEAFKLLDSIAVAA